MLDSSSNSPEAAADTAPLTAIAPGVATLLTQSMANWISYFLLACGFAMILFAAYSVYLVYTPLLWVDQWMFIQELAGNHGHYSAALLWKQHNDHRIPLPKLFYLADLYWFHGRNLFLLVTIFALQLLHLAWLAMVFRRIGDLGGSAWRTAMALAAVCLFAMRQSENFWFGSDLPMVLPYLCATIAFSSLGFLYQGIRTGERYSRWPLVIAWIAAVAASLSLTNGLLLWPMLILLMLVWRMPARLVAATVVLAALVIGFWRIGYVTPLSTPALSSVPLMVRYVLVLYGSSWTCVNETFGMLISAIAIPTAAVAYLWVLLKRRTDTFAMVMLSIASFALGSTMMTAIGRIRFGLEQARSDRYQTAAMLFWCALFVLLIRAAARAKRPAGWLLPIQAAMASVLFLAAQLAPPVADGARVHARKMREVALALEAGVDDAPSIMYVLVPPFHADDVLLLAGFLRDHQWSIFRETQAYPLGRSLKRFYKLVAPAACKGSLDSVSGIADYRWPGFRFIGWAYDIAAGTIPTEVVLADASGRIIGVGATGFLRPDIPASVPGIRQRDTGFFGYIPGDLESEQAAAYAILADGMSACPFTIQPAHLNVASTVYSGLEPTGLSRDLTFSREIPVSRMEFLGGVALGNTEPIKVNAEGQQKLEGWIVDPGLRSGRAADLSVDGVPLAAQYGFGRPDVARWFSSAEAGRCGFQATLPKLPRGPHTLAIRLISADQDLYYQSRPLTILVP
jgi:hypothetical protein